MHKFFIDSTRGVSVVGESDGEFYEYLIFDNDYTRFDIGLNKRLPLEYADVVSDSVSCPIDFSWDTGQKTDSIRATKQFVESKLVFATLSEEDSFPFKLYIAVDGDPHTTVTDVSTDAPFWKTSDNESKGVLGTAFTLGGIPNPATGIFNTLRQLVVRYSGKGKSIRHVIEGKSLYNFKLYETYIRYKNLNVK
jgi:hypothetical protein